MLEKKRFEVKDRRHAGLVTCSSLFICAVPTSHGAPLVSVSVRLQLEMQKQRSEK